MLRLEHQREAADQLAIGNVITSMRLVSSIDWTLFFERASVVEQILREDPAGAYPLMDFPTRDRYRHAIEGLAKRARQPETAVAPARSSRRAAAKTQDPGARPPAPRRLLPDLPRPLRARAGIGLLADVARARRAVHLRASGARLPRHDRRPDRARGRQPAAVRRSATAPHARRALCWLALRGADPGQRAGHQPRPPAASPRRFRRGRCRSWRCRTASRRRCGRWSWSRRCSTPPAAVDSADRRPRSALPRQPRRQPALRAADRLRRRRQRSRGPRTTRSCATRARGRRCS